MLCAYEGIENVIIGNYNLAYAKEFVYLNSRDLFLNDQVLIMQSKDFVRKSHMCIQYALMIVTIL